MEKVKSHRISLSLFLLLFCLLALAVGVTKAAAGPMATIAIGATTRVSVSSEGTQGNDSSWSPSISGDGRFVAFDSWAGNLVPGDTNLADDVFVHDRDTGETTRVSVASDGTEGNYASRSPSISGDGRYVAFDSWASNLVPGDTNGEGDVFVHDRVTGETTRVSVASDGSESDDWSYSPSIAVDGRYVAFTSEASNLVPGDTNDTYDVFLHDRVTGETTRVSVASDGTQGDDGSGAPSVSGDGRYVAFISEANNLVPGEGDPILSVFLHDQTTGETVRASVASDGTPGTGLSSSPSISAIGRFVVFSAGASNLVPGDTNGEDDVFVHDWMTGQTTRVSVASGGTESNARSLSPQISGNGRYVAFESLAGNLVPDDTNDARDVFVHDRVTGETTRVSVSGEGTEGNGLSFYPTISGNGRYVAFDSWASNLVQGDTNETADVFVHDRYFGYLPSHLPFISKP